MLEIEDTSKDHNTVLYKLESRWKSFTFMSVQRQQSYSALNLRKNSTPMWHICYSPYAHNFITPTGTPHMQIFLDPRTFTYEDSPYAYGDQFLMCQRSFLESRVESEFSHASRNESYGMGIKIKWIPVCIRGLHVMRSPCAYRDQN